MAELIASLKFAFRMICVKMKMFCDAFAQNEILDSVIRFYSIYVVDNLMVGKRSSYVISHDNSVLVLPASANNNISMTGNALAGFIAWVCTGILTSEFRPAGPAPFTFLNWFSANNTRFHLVKEHTVSA